MARCGRTPPINTASRPFSRLPGLKGRHPFFYAPCAAVHFGTPLTPTCPGANQGRPHRRQPVRSSLCSFQLSRSPELFSSSVQTVQAFGTNGNIHRFCPPLQTLLAPHCCSAHPVSPASLHGCHTTHQGSTVPALFTGYCAWKRRRLQIVSRLRLRPNVTFHPREIPKPVGYSKNPSSTTDYLPRANNGSSLLHTAPSLSRGAVTRLSYSSAPDFSRCQHVQVSPRCPDALQHPQKPTCVAIVIPISVDPDVRTDCLSFPDFDLYQAQHAFPHAARFCVAQSHGQHP